MGTLFGHMTCGASVVLTPRAVRYDGGELARAWDRDSVVLATVYIADVKALLLLQPRMSILCPVRPLIKTSILNPLRTTVTQTQRPLTQSTRTMSSDTSAPNFNFPEKQPSSEEKALIDDVLQLCKCGSYSSTYMCL
jgi:hypothetical protein